MTNSTLLFSTPNPFINIVHLLSKNNSDLDITAMNLINSLCESDLINKYDINESFFATDKNSTHTIQHCNIFYLLSLLNKGANIDLIDYTIFFNKLFNIGLKIEDSYQYNIDNYNKLLFTNKQELDNFITLHPHFLTKKQHPVYSYMELSEKRNIFFINHLLSLNKKENTFLDIKKYNAYHKAVSFNNLEVLQFFQDIKMDINVLDNNLNTPIMYCKKMETLKLLNNGSPNLLLKNVNGDDVSSLFNIINDLPTRKEMVNFIDEQISNYINNTNKSHKEEIPQDYIDERVRFNLLKLVQSDKTKKELQDFMKKYKPKDIGTIVDEQGNNLLILSLKSNNWARASLFIDHCDIQYTNYSDHNALYYLLSKCSLLITRIDDAFPFLNMAISNYDNSKNEKSLFLELLEKQILNMNQGPSIPSWCLTKDIKYITSLGFPNEDAIKWFNKFKSHNQNYGRDQIISDSIEFYLSGFKNEEKTFNFNSDKIINDVLIKRIALQTGKIDYSIYPTTFDNFNILIKTMEKMQMNTEALFIRQNFLLKINNFIEEGIKEHCAYYNNGMTPNEIIEENQNDFIKKMTPLITYILENEPDNFMKLPKEFISYSNYPKELEIKLRYVIMNTNLSSNHNTIKKIKI